MHISEGVLSAPVLISGAVFAAAGIGIGLRHLNEEKIILCGILAAAFFVGSLIHVPIGVSSAHLLLTGLLGVILGWAAFPAIFTALLLQAILFQYGGITVLGINTFTMGTAAVGSWYLFRFIYSLWPNKKGLLVAAFCGGFFGVCIAVFLTASALAFTDEGFKAAATILLAAHLPVMIVEGIITAFTVEFLSRVKPELLKVNLQG